MWNLENRAVGIIFCKLKFTFSVEKWLLDVVFIKITKSLDGEYLHETTQKWSAQ